MRKTLIGLVVIAAIGCASQRAERIAAEGRAAYKASDWPRASLLLGQAAAIDGSNSRLRSDLGWSLLMQHECFPAREQFTRAIALEPGLPEANRGLEVSSRCATAATLR